jgi:hypothetical protein
MKRLLLSGLSVLLVSALQIPAVKAQTNFDEPAYRVEPFNLVHLGYQGYFEKEGIPSNGAFIAAVEAGKITPIALVNSAIEQGKLPSETLNDQRYLEDVGTQLKFIEQY